MSQEFNPKVLPSARAQRRRNDRDFGVAGYALVVGAVVALVLAIVLFA